MIRINLPKPISTNQLFKNKRRGRACTERYNTWKWHAMAMIREQKPPKPNGKVRLRFLVGEKGIRADADGDNMIKCLQDALVDNGILADDKRTIVRAVGMEWVEGMEGAQAVIEPVLSDNMVPIEGQIS